MPLSSTDTVLTPGLSPSPLGLLLRAPGREDQQHRAVDGDAQRCLHRQEQLPREAEVRLFKALSFFRSVPSDMFALGDAASTHPDTSGSECVGEAVGIPVKRSLLCAVAVGCTGHLGWLRPDLAVRDFRHQ